MDSFKGQGSIQMLLTTEQEAQKGQNIVSIARNLKIARLKQAKEEAEREVALYRSHLEAEFQKKISETSGSSVSNVKRLEEETEGKIRNLNESASRISHEVIGMLIKYITTLKT